jgi:hypothetical protein
MSGIVSISDGNDKTELSASMKNIAAGDKSPLQCPAFFPAVLTEESFLRNEHLKK